MTEEELTPAQVWFMQLEDKPIDAPRETSYEYLKDHFEKIIFENSLNENTRRTASENSAEDIYNYLKQNGFLE